MIIDQRQLDELSNKNPSSHLHSGMNLRSAPDDNSYVLFPSLTVLLKPAYASWTFWGCLYGFTKNALNPDSFEIV